MEENRKDLSQFFVLLPELPNQKFRIKRRRGKGAQKWRFLPKANRMETPKRRKNEHGIALVLLGLSAYMYDALGRETSVEDEDAGILPGFFKFCAVALAPLRYLIFSIRRGNFRALLPFSAYLILLAALLILGRLARITQ